MSGLEIGGESLEERWEEISGGRTALFWFGMWVQRKLSELRLTGGPRKALALGPRGGDAQSHSVEPARETRD